MVKDLFWIEKVLSILVFFFFFFLIICHNSKLEWDLKNVTIKKTNESKASKSKVKMSLSAGDMIVS